MRTAYMAGKWQQGERVKAQFPYLQYLTDGGAHVRASHGQWHQRVFPRDDPFWDTWYPLNGYGCHCTVRSVSKRQVEREKLTVETAPEIKQTRRTNPDTGEVYGSVAEGLDDSASDERQGKIVVAMNFIQKGEVSNSVRSAGLVSLDNLNDRNHYEVVSGKL